MKYELKIPQGYPDRYGGQFRIKNINSRFYFYIIIIWIVSSCNSKNEDIIFAASDELHSLRMNKNEKRFELIYNGFNSAYGTYSISNDTIFLTYDTNSKLIPVEGGSNEHPNNMLARLVVIDKMNNRIQSIDNKKQFCAHIHLNLISDNAE